MVDLKVKNYLVLEANPSDESTIMSLMNEIDISSDQIDIYYSLHEIEVKPYDFILCDLNVNNLGINTTIKTIINKFPDSILIILSNMNETEIALEAIQLGAQDFIIKDETNYIELKKSLLLAYQKKQIAQMIKFNEHKLCRLIENNYGAIIIFDLNSTVSFASPSVKYIMGYTPEEMLGYTFYELIHPDELKMVKSKYNYLIINKKDTIKLKFRIGKKDGDYIWINATLSNRMNDMAINGIILNFEDINQNEYNQILIRKYENTLIEVTNAIPGAVFRFRLLNNGVYKMEFISKGIEYISGFKSDEYSEDLLDFIKKRLNCNQLSKLLSIVDHSKDKLTPFEFEYSIHHKDGNMKWVKIQAITSYDDNDKSYVWNGVVTDITDNVKINNENKRLVNIIEKSLNEIFVINSETYQFEFINYGALLNIGFSKEEMEKMTPLNILPDFDSLSFEQLLNPLKEKLVEKLVLETNHRRKDGSIYPVEAHIQLIEGEQKSMFVTIVVDNTDRNKYIKAIKEQYLLLQGIAYDQSHAVRGPLARLMGLINLVNENLYKDKVELMQLLKLINISANELDQVNKDIILKTQKICFKDSPSF